MTTKRVSTSIKEKVISYYEKAGLDYAEWDKDFNMHFGYFKWGMNPFNLSAMLNQMNEEVYRRLKLETYTEPTVLDLGCGLTASSRYMALRNREALFYGITITPWQVEFGNKLNEEADLYKRIAIVKTDFANIPFTDGMANAAFAIESSCYAKGDNKKDLINEMYRVLKSGGRFVLTDGFRKHNNPLPKWLDKIYRKNLEGWALTDLGEIHLFVKALKEAGFKNIKVEDISWKVAPSFMHIPFTVFKFFWKRFLKKEKTPLSKERRNNALGPLWGMLLGLSRKHFSYYIVSGEK